MYAALRLNGYLDMTTCNQIFITLCNLTLYLYICSSNNRSNMDQSAMPILTKIHIPTKHKFIYFVFHINLRRYLFIFVLVNCVRDESCREILAPTSPSGIDIIDTAIISAHRCTI